MLFYLFHFFFSSVAKKVTSTLYIYHCARSLCFFSFFYIFFSCIIFSFICYPNALQQNVVSTSVYIIFFFFLLFRFIYLLFIFFCLVCSFHPLVQNTVITRVCHRVYIAHFHVFYFFFVNVILLNKI